MFPCGEEATHGLSSETVLATGISPAAGSAESEAVTALTWNPLVKAHYERLREAGKPRMVALAACMRKMLLIVYGVLKHQQPFDPAWQSQPQAHSSS